jgi:predicted dehydrogenase
MTNVGIVGLGFMAVTHIKAIKQIPELRIGALCNPSGRNLDGDFSDVAGNLDNDDPIKLDMAGVKAFRDFDELLADPKINLIDICTPTAFHAPFAIAGLKAGKHVLCEKPMARTSDEARAMIEAAEASTGFLMPAMCLRFWPEWSFVKQAIDDGRFGKVEAARFRRVGEPPAWGQKFFLDGSKSGGALLDLHIHDVDFIHHCFGRPRSVYSTGYAKVSGAVDYVVTQYRFDSGATVHAEGGWTMTPGFGFNMAYTVNFENATLDYDMSRGDEALRLFESDKDAQTLKLDGDDGYVGELRHLLEAIQSGKKPTRVSPEDGRIALEICEAEERSIDSGESVALA